ncbi:hypothetical protein C8T65DRAFT_98727 [Cerioporus squamosus]|nr:hypothetical protein C8T65DRAFT_98727 [Cerioporus squamosus]
MMVGTLSLISILSVQVLLLVDSVAWAVKYAGSPAPPDTVGPHPRMSIHGRGGKVGPAQTRLRHVIEICHAGSGLAGPRQWNSNLNVGSHQSQNPEPAIDRESAF